MGVSCRSPGKDGTGEGRKASSCGPAVKSLVRWAELHTQESKPQTSLNIKYTLSTLVKPLPPLKPAAVGWFQMETPEKKDQNPLKYKCPV